MNRLGEGRQHRRVQGVGLRQLASGLGEVAHLAGINDRYRPAGKPASASAATTKRSSPPVPSSTINCGCRGRNRPTNSALPASALAPRQASLLGHIAISSAALLTSLPTNMAATACACVAMDPVLP